jgi:integrase
MERPRPEIRARLAADEDIRRFIAAAGTPEFGDLLWVLYHTGARPSEIAKLTPNHLDLDRRVAILTVHEHKTGHRTHKPRAIYFNDAAFSLVSRLYQERRFDTLFLNSKGTQWTINSMHKAAEKAKEKAGLQESGITPYSLRHSWITRALAKGVPIAIVAELAGTSVAMIQRTYSHVCDHHKLLADTVNQVI